MTALFENMSLWLFRGEWISDRQPWSAGGAGLAGKKLRQSCVLISSFSTIPVQNSDIWCASVGNRSENFLKVVARFLKSNANRCAGEWAWTSLGSLYKVPSDNAQGAYKVRGVSASIESGQRDDCFKIFLTGSTPVQYLPAARWEQSWGAFCLG